MWTEGKRREGHVRMGTNLLHCIGRFRVITLTTTLILAENDSSMSIERLPT
jgi:hypothetical protein